MNDYELLDFGDGRRLERFGTKIVDRLCPTAEDVRKENPTLWKTADFRFVPDEKFQTTKRGRWTPNTPEPWTIDIDSIRFELQGSPFGHLGVFPEQRKNWHRLRQNLGDAHRVLNLFAYTGGSSIASNVAGTPAEKAGVSAKSTEVVHVDSAKSVVDRARRNAELSGISSGIRYIVEDVRKFVSRELKRGNRYDAVILDPPSYGHGVKGEPWKIFEHLPPLLADLVALLSDRPRLFLLTAHTPGLETPRLHDMLLEAGLPGGFDAEAFSMELVTNTGRKLPSGCGVLFLYR